MSQLAYLADTVNWGPRSLDYLLLTTYADYTQVPDAHILDQNVPKLRNL
jgi:hypothetical protein